MTRDKALEILQEKYARMAEGRPVSLWPGREQAALGVAIKDMLILEERLNARRVTPPKGE